MIVSATPVQFSRVLLRKETVSVDSFAVAKLDKTKLYGNEIGTQTKYLSIHALDLYRPI